MKAKPFKGAVAPDPTGKKPTDILMREDLVALIAKRLPRKPADNESDRRRRANSAVYDDVHHPDQRLKMVAHRQFTWGDVGAWARKRWPGLFEDLPCFPQTATAALKAGGRMRPRGRALPGTIAECHAMIMRLDDRNAALERHIEELRSRVNKKSRRRRKKIIHRDNSNLLHCIS